jgi:hypothetical protein
MAEEGKQTKISKTGIIAIVSAGVVIIALLAVIVVLMVSRQNSTSQMASDANSTAEVVKRDVVVTPDNVDEVVQQIAEEEYTPAGYYMVTMNSTWNFKDGKSASENAYVENADYNTNDVYFDITLADTGENIYSSPVLPVGSHLDDIVLDKELDDGTYDCVIKYTLVDEEQNPLSDVSVSLTIVIGE